MGTLLYFKRLPCWAQQRFCTEYWTPKAMGCSLMFWETTIPPIIIFGVKHENNINKSFFNILGGCTFLTAQGYHFGLAEVCCHCFEQLTGHQIRLRNLS